MEGCTIERKNHGRIVIEPRTVTKGGVVSEYGNRDAEHCYLDWLRHHGHLGNNTQDVADRYDAGMRLRELWFTFNRRGVVYEAGATKDPSTTDSEVGSPEDIAETAYIRVLRLVHEKYRLTARDVAIDEHDRHGGAEYYEHIRDAMDALCGAFRFFYKN